MKQRFRSILALVLVVISTFLVSCSSPKEVVKKVTYTPAQVEQIQHYVADIQELRDRMLRIPPLVQREDWSGVKSIIHGPLGDLRFKMINVSRLLDPTAQEDARTSSKEIFGHLVKIDEAAQVQDKSKALKNYNDALADFDAFLKLIPNQPA